ncbi:hypothetical protein [Thermincola potens]|uniref:Integral membrane protein n=1 Tax=Thermincola potens (strain JR) TaxID=635013 RepID=D5X8H8_THEPJ|nr:hypothetical protein [Thermincola potens]ADG82854.1 integral membrane protein [Thermincola potens JR]
MLKVRVRDNSIQIGKHFSVDFQRTLRITDDGNTYPLPPGLGRFPVFKVEDYASKVPASWREHGGVFIPMYQREALWLNFNGAYWRPNAVKIAVGKINAISGKEWDQELKAEEQDYIVCPDQPWLDGINAGDGYIRQFVAMPLGMGYTVEGQVTGREEFGGIQIIVYDPKPGIFPDEQPDYRMDHLMLCESAVMSPPCCGEMGLAAGGKMKQSIYPDEYGIETWDQANYGRVYVHIVNSMMFRDITGLEPPPTPISAKTYTEYGFPWFDFLDEEKGDVSASGILSKVKSVKEMDKEKGFAPQQDDSSVEIPENQVKKIKLDPESVIDGKW